MLQQICFCIGILICYFILIRFCLFFLLFTSVAVHLVHSLHPNATWYRHRIKRKRWQEKWISDSINLNLLPRFMDQSISPEGCIRTLKIELKRIQTHRVKLRLLVDSLYSFYYNIQNICIKIGKKDVKLFLFQEVSGFDIDSIWNYTFSLYVSGLRWDSALI